MPRPLPPMQTPGDRSHRAWHSRAHFNQLHIPLTRPDSQGTRLQSPLHADFTGRPQGCGHGGAFRLESRGVSVGARPGLPPHKGQDPQRLSSHTALSSAPPPAPAGWEGGPGYAPFQRAGGLLPVPLALADLAQGVLRPGHVRVWVEGGRQAARSRSPPCRPPISPSLAEAPPAPNGKAPLPAQGEMRRGRRDRLGAPPPPPRLAPGARPGPRPPSLAQVRPGPGSGGSRAVTGPGMRTAASLPVKVSPGPSCRTRSGRGRRRREGCSEET